MQHFEKAKDRKEETLDFSLTSPFACLVLKSINISKLWSLYV